MDTNLKNAISAMRMKIAEMEKEQKSTKLQRKTVHFTGERTMCTWEATERAQTNKGRLRLYYAAYGLLRSKNFDITEKNPKREECYKYHPLCHWLPQINGILNEFGYQLKNYVEKEDYWKRKYKSYDMERYEEIVRIGE